VPPTVRVTAQTLPAAVASLTSTYSAGTSTTTGLTRYNVRLGWVDQSTNETEMRVIRKTRNPDGTWSSATNIAALPMNTTTYMDTTARGDGTYHYRVDTCNLVGCSTNSRTIQIAAPPTGVTATVASLTQVNVSWTDASSLESFYRIQRRQRSGFD
jgi:hypothetical protein